MFKELNNTFFRFILVGMANTGLGFSIIWFCMYVLQSGYWVSTLIGNLFGMLLSFWLNKGFTFRYQVRERKRIQKVLYKFIGVALGAYILAYGSAPLLLTLLDFNAWWRDYLSVVVGIILYTHLSYLGHKGISFRDRP